MKKKKKTLLAVTPPPAFSLGSKKLQLSMTRRTRCGCSCPGKTRAPAQPWRKRPPLAHGQPAPWGRGRKLPLTCCLSWERQITGKKCIFPGVCVCVSSAMEGRGHLQRFFRGPMPLSHFTRIPDSGGIISTHHSATIEQVAHHAGASHLHSGTSIFSPSWASLVNNGDLFHRALDTVSEPFSMQIGGSWSES